MKGKSVALLIIAVGLVVVAALLYPLLHDKLEELSVHVPEYQRPPEVVRLDQNWTAAQRKRFHHTPQGTRLVPYDWFKALEQPCLSLSGCGMFTDPAYLDRFGFIPSEADPELNPDGLPVGFAIDREFVDPLNKKAYPVVGLNCAACHSNEVYYGKYAVQIEGAPATIEVTAFQKALGLALAFNTSFPFSIGRYSRFEQRVLGPNATAEQKAELQGELRRLPERGACGKESHRRPPHLRQRGRLQAHGCARPHRQPGVRRRHEERRQLHGVDGAGSLSANLGRLLVQLGAVQLVDRRSAGPQHRRSARGPRRGEAVRSGCRASSTIRSTSRDFARSKNCWRVPDR